MRDEKKLLDTVHPQLASVIVEGIREFEKFAGLTVRVTSGFRTAEEQLELFRLGKTRTTHSAHMKGCAVDLAIIEGKHMVTRFAWYNDLNRFVQKAAVEFDIVVGWGGNWKMRDGCHWWIADDVYQMASVLLLADLTKQETTPAKDGGARQNALTVVKPSD